MKLCVHGLGYVGLSTAALFANAGHDVAGYDTDPVVVRRLVERDLPLTEPDLRQFVCKALDGSLSVGTEAPPADYHLVCVPTPYSDGADLTCVEQAGTAISQQLRAGDTVVVESTVPPGTTAGPVASRLEASGLVAGESFHLAYAPETVMPGNTVSELHDNDRIVGGIDADSATAVRDLYAPVVEGDVHVAPDATTAEFVKLAQNAARDVNIAFANELALVADDYDVDVREAIGLANTHPRVGILDPGPGVGGHCLPVDPLFLAEESDSTTLIERARTVNDGMTDHLLARLRSELDSLPDATVAILGVAYKGNVAETRNSPGLALADRLASTTPDAVPVTDGGSTADNIRLTDPHVSDDSLNLWPLSAALDGADAAVVTAGHDAYTTLDPGEVADRLATPLVVDAVDVLDDGVWEAHGFTVLDV